MPEIRYSIKNNRLKKALNTGFTVDGDSIGSKVSGGLFFLEPVDSVSSDASWGRLHFELTKTETSTVAVYVFASNIRFTTDGMDADTWKQLLATMGYKRYVDLSDVLLYDLLGRYFYLGFEVIGEGDIFVSGIKLDRQGDNFMQVFPEVYQERNSFFHRYMSLFSSIYNDFDERIEKLPQILDLDKTDIKFLPVIAGWMGLNISVDFFDEDILRRLVKEAYSLNRMKGTKKCLERIVEIVIGDGGIVIEKNQIGDYFTAEQKKHLDSLYGDSVYDVTLLIESRLDNIRQSQLQYVLEQYLPLRCSLHIVGLDRLMSLDSYTYMDMNAKVFIPVKAQLDSGVALDNGTVVK